MNKANKQENEAKLDQIIFSKFLTFGVHILIDHFNVNIVISF